MSTPRLSWNLPRGDALTPRHFLPFVQVLVRHFQQHLRRASIIWIHADSDAHRQWRVFPLSLQSAFDAPPNLPCHGRLGIHQQQRKLVPPPPCRPIPPPARPLPLARKTVAPPHSRPTP